MYIHFCTPDTFFENESKLAGHDQWTGLFSNPNLKYISFFARK